LNATELTLGDLVNLSSLDFGSLNLSLNILDSSACPTSDSSSGEYGSSSQNSTSDDINYDVALFDYSEHGDDWGKKFK